MGSVMIYLFFQMILLCSLMSTICIKNKHIALPSAQKTPSGFKPRTTRRTLVRKEPGEFAQVYARIRSRDQISSQGWTEADDGVPDKEDMTCVGHHVKGVYEWLKNI